MPELINEEPLEAPMAVKPAFRKWSAKVTDVSSVDITGTVEVSYEIVDERGTVIYPSQRIQASPSEIVDIIKRQGSELKQKTVEAELIKVGDLIAIEEA